jgi:hydrogenase expression/formation protein HypE
MKHPEDMVCPAPHPLPPMVTMAHGGGGVLMQRLIQATFRRVLDPHAEGREHDAALVELAGGRIALTTDAFVVNPLFFPGGDIGALAVCGTVNDLAMSGARPLGLAAAFILEEGLPLATLERVVASMQAAAEQVPVAIITGDTKVVDRGKGDGLYITTTGIGLAPSGLAIEPQSVRPGDAILVSGDIGRHGIAIMAAREGLGLETAIESDMQPLWETVDALLRAGIEVHCMRDATRGGLGAALVEVLETAGLGAEIDEPSIPVRDAVRGVCELLGLEALHVANEGRFVVFLPEDQADAALRVLDSHAQDTHPARIGRVTDTAGRVHLVGAIGARRFLDRPTGEQLPRIC